MQQLHHFGGQQPAFAGLLAERDDAVYLFAQFPERKRGRKSPASRQNESERQPQRQQRAQKQIADGRAPHTAVVVLPTIHFIVQSVQNKIGEIGHDGFAAFRFHDLDRIIVGVGMIL